jgi:hypothetical protein
MGGNETMRDGAGVADTMTAEAGFARPTLDVARIVGHGVYELRGACRHVRLPGLLSSKACQEGRCDEMPLLARGEFSNLVTQVGDQYVGERAAGIASPPAQVTGMRLGTGTTAVAKTGAGAAIVTYVSGSNKAIDGGFPTSALSGSSRRIQWKTSWAAGEATATGIAEAVVTNENPLTNVAGSAANALSRALLSPTVNKGASDTLAVTWNWDLLGA